MADLFYLVPFRDGDASQGSYDDQSSAESGAADLLARVRGDITSVAVVQLVSVIEAQPVQVTAKAAADVVAAVAAEKAALQKGVVDESTPASPAPEVLVP